MRIRNILFCVLLYVCAPSLRAQVQTNSNVSPFYSRAEKITKSLSLSESVRSKVNTLIADRYQCLNDLQQKRDEQIKEAKLNSDKETFSQAKETISAAYQQKITKTHQSFVRKLSRKLDDLSIDVIKDGMTYNVAPNTMKAYKEMIPSLTPAQCSQIWIWLVEARELAMDGESSEKKHAMFGKYKGRINNYLSAQGYDLKKEGEEWQKRIQANKSAK